MNTRDVFLISILLFTFSSSLGQAPKYSNEFLTLGVGAPALAMANSFIAHSSDVTSGYWNPAGLLGVKSNLQVGYMHNEYFAGIAKYDYGAIATRVDETTVIGFTPLLRFGVDDIPDTSELIDATGNINYDRIKSFSAADYAFLFSFAKTSPIENLNYGANFKVIHRKVGEFASAWGFGLDIGVQYQLNQWKFAAMGRDITSTFNAWSFNTEKLEEVFSITGNEIPENSLEITLPKLILGAGKTTQIAKKLSLYSEIDLDITFDGMRNVLIKSDPISIDPHLGFELGYGKFAFLRGGIGYIQQITEFDGSKKTVFQPNMGLGIKIKSFSIDYALTNIGESTGLLSNVFSLTMDINKKPIPESPSS